MQSVVSPGKFCLLAEDNELTRHALGTLIEDAGYQVLYAGNGQEALEQLQHAVPPAVIVMDLRMPVLDGWELLRYLKRKPELAHVPVVVVSSEVEARREVENMGAAGYLPKPVDVDDLLTLLGRLAQNVGRRSSRHSCR
jgi:CheY-like chemotaxis protein